MMCVECFVIVKSAPAFIIGSALGGKLWCPVVPLASWPESLEGGDWEGWASAHVTPLHLQLVRNGQ